MIRRLTVCLASLFLICACSSTPTRTPAAPASQRQDFLERFARGYYPGRSGQIFLVPREGDFITIPDPSYAFTHGSPWSYDSRIPILFYGPPFIRQGEFDSPVAQQDVAPTLAALLGTTPPSTTTGHAQRQVLEAVNAHPKVIALFVLDAMRVDYFDRFADVMPTLSRLRREGAWFSRAQVNYLPTVTSVGHATIGTGTDPRFHGQASNNLFNAATGKVQQAYDKLDPRELMTLTLADLWNLETEGRAVIVGQGGAIRAVAGLVGHGACIVGGKKVFVGSYKSDGSWETNSDCYQLPDSLKTSNPKPYWEAVGGTWMNHDISDPVKFRASSLFQRFEGDALVGVIEHEAIGADDTTDLLLVNMKGPDYTAHAYGPDSSEIRETLAELDRQIARVIAALGQKAGLGQTVVAITADHGMASEPSNGHRRIYWEEVVEAIHRKFDPAEKKIVRYYEDPANQQIYIDSARLRTLGFSLKEVAAFLETLPYVQVAFTEDEVRAVSLPRDR
jgi:predicted AlkP superfamily pyrophosphatase or phosphodiesterase